MDDFDITNLRGKKSFVDSLKKRKAFGLFDSDSEEETPIKKKNTGRKNEVISDSQDSVKSVHQDLNSADFSKENLEKQNNEVEEGKPEEEGLDSSYNPYLKSGPDIELIRSLSVPNHKPHLESPSNNTLRNESTSLSVDLSDNDNLKVDALIEDLDPDLAELINDSTSIPVAEPQKIEVKLQYIHNFQNLSDNAKKVIERLLKPVKLIIMDNTQFNKILDVFCSHKKLKKTDVVLVYNDDTVFLNGTPAGLGMGPNVLNTMQVYPKQCYASLLQEKEQKKEERRKKWAQAKENDDILDLAQFETSINSAESNNSTELDENGNKFLIKLRSNDNDDIMLRVKGTSTIGSVIARYKEVKNISGDITLSFEGEILDINSTIADTDLEEDDLVEVNIL